jgi:hypothetical protein
MYKFEISTIDIVLKIFKLYKLKSTILCREKQHGIVDFLTISENLLLFISIFTLSVNYSTMAN